MKKVRISLTTEGLEFILNPDNGRWGITNNLQETPAFLEEDFSFNCLCGTRLTLMNVTKECNLACKYCFIGDKKEENTNMPLSIAKKTVEKVAEMKKGVKEIVFHGSEPLMNFGLIRETICYGKNLDEDIKYSIQTNGTLLDNERINFFIKNQVSIGISLDGLEHHQNETRPFKKGGGTYKEVVKNLEKIRREGGNFSLISVVTKNNVEELPEIVDLSKDLGAKYLSFHPVINVGEDIRPSNENLTNSLIETSENYFEDKLSGKITPLLDHPKRYLYMILAPKNTENCLRCASGPLNPLLAVDTNGDIYPCDNFWDEEEYIIGNIKDMPLDEASSSKKNFRNVEKEKSLEGCLNCDWKRICSGGCPGEKTVGNKMSYCKTTKEMLTYYASKIDELKTNGLLRKIMQT